MDVNVLPSTNRMSILYYYFTFYHNVLRGAISFGTTDCVCLN